MINTAVIMAGGKGTRLRPFTYMTPKPLLPYKGLPLIEHMIINLVKYKINRIYILVNYNKQKFNSCLKYKEKYNIDLKIVAEDKFMGTIGGLYLIKKELKKPFIVVNGDLYTHINFSKMIETHVKYKPVMTIGIKTIEIKLPYGKVITRLLHVFTIKEKESIYYKANAGIYILEPELIKLLNNKSCDFIDLFNIVKHVKAVVYYDIKNIWKDIGEIDKYEEV